MADEAYSAQAMRAARAEAAVWMVRLHGDRRTPELEAGFRAWLAADPEHARQFEHMDGVWELGGAVDAASLPRMRMWARQASRRSWVLAISMALACLCFGVLFYWHWSGVYVTDHGEQRLIRLKDGSSVYLNSDSRLRVEFDSRVRRVRLEGGEGLFEIAKDPRHPFVVEAGRRQVTALGTTFVVRYEPSRTAITLVEGKVTVTGASLPLPGSSAGEDPRGSGDADRRREPPLGSAVTLLPGERLVVAQNERPKVDSPRVDAITAWRRGQVLLEATALPEAVAELNRYDRRLLVIDDPALGKIRVSGIYRTGDSAGFAHAVAELNHFEVSERADEIHLYRRVGQDNTD